MQNACGYNPVAFARDFVLGVVFVPHRPHVFSIVYGPSQQAAEKLMLLKGTAFRPYVNALQRIRL